MKKLLLISILSIFLITFVTATSVGNVNSDFTEGKVIYTSPVVPINYSTVGIVNSSEYWDLLNDPSDFGTCGAGEYAYAFDVNGAIQCRADVIGAGGSQWLVDLANNYLYNSSNTLFFNGTTLGYSYLNLSGTNANQNIDIGIYNFSANYGLFGGLNITKSFAQFSGNMENDRGSLSYPNVEIGEDTYPTILFDDGVGSDPWMIDFLTGSGLRFYQSGNVHMIVDTTGIITDENVTIGGLFKGQFNWTSADNWNIFDGSSLTFNETKLNETISNEGIRLGFNSTYNATYDAFESGNASWNESMAYDLFLNRTSESSYLSTYNATYNDYITANISNSTTWWADLTGFVSTWFYNNGNELDFNETKLNETISTEGVRLGFNESGGTNYYPSKINLTIATYNGAMGGYASANAICNGEYTGSHLCTEFEISSWFANAGSGITGDAWVTTGSPKFIPADVPVNDCNGWTYSGTVSYLGNYWHFNETEMGDGRALNCGTEFSLACCTY